ncbi:ribose 5-phosphate isomerase [Eremomyces bilateralis CBS 781.70]|uniref:Ribose-5-phosphate isomerase n=1 Tax=Eremomyces bilateralis CBS 781.70 TaxID=1392243 RepID=A0A6G1FXW9_9PEZI|nr:ribose 5-phosphate isomerase [Eremomyces bilateralis CBS 781.70]KAF1810516.1 ribose 5-phosphate isomerase [Eremomyces bilateralis CBS 781.70]
MVLCCSAVSAVEQAKRLAAVQAVSEHFSTNFKYVGIGSGSTVKYVVEAIAASLAKAFPAASTRPSDTRSTSATSAYDIQFVPTGYQSRQSILDCGLTPLLFDHLPNDVILDVAFDGADEVDDDLNCIKGGGACLFQEKLVIEKAKKFVCVADYRKAQSRLLTVWPSIPIEVAPIASHIVLMALENLGSVKPAVRAGVPAKSGPLRTDQAFYIIDAPFPTLLLRSDIQGPDDGNGKNGRWEVSRLSEAIKNITGVLEVGIFSGYDGYETEKLGLGKGGQKPVAVYFGMQDGTVTIRMSKNR